MKIAATKEPNSKLIKQFDSVLLAKRFLEQANSEKPPDLTQTSKSNFTELLDRIEEAFKIPQLSTGEEALD